MLSRRFDIDDSGVEILADAVRKLQARATQWFDQEAANATAQSVELVVDARYVGQNFELAVPLASGMKLTAFDIPDTDQLHSRFRSAHETAYGYASAENPVEIVNIRLSARASLHLSESPSTAPLLDSTPRPNGVRAIYFEADAAVEADVFARADLGPGQTIEGPAVIEQLDTTTLIYPHDHAEVHAQGHLIVRVNASGDNGQ